MAFALYVDEDIARRRLVEPLRRAGCDVLTVVEAGREGFSDEQQLAFAADEGRTIVTANQGDYARLHGRWMLDGRHHEGIIVITSQRSNPEHLAISLLDLHATRDSHQMRDAILFISPGRPGDR